MLPPDLYKRIAHEHTGCGMELNEIRFELEKELEEVGEILSKEGSKLRSGISWQEILKNYPHPKHNITRKRQAGVELSACL